MLMEPPLEVVWAEQAGPMSWVEAPTDWPRWPLDEPGFETSHWLAEIEDAERQPDPGWCFPGVERFGDAPPRPPRPEPSPDVAALAVAVAGLATTDPVSLPP